MYQRAIFFLVILFSLLAISLKPLAQTPASTAVFYNDGAELTLQTNSLLYVDADYIQQSGKIQNEGTMALAANWVNNSTKNVFKNNFTGTVNLVGEDQVIGGEEPTQFDVLTLSGKGIKTLENNQDVAGALNLEDSEVATGNYILHLINSSPSSLSRISGFVRSAKTGGLRRNTSLSQDYLFPIGFKNDNGMASYRPVVIKPNTATDNSYTAAILPDISTIDNLDILTREPAIEALNTRYYVKLNRDMGTSPVNLALFYDTKADDNYNTLINWQESTRKLLTLATAEESVFGNLDEKLSLRQWNDFSHAYYLLGQTKQLNSAFEITNVISPNNDGKNDSWQILPFDGSVENEVYVYNRWGSEVYHKVNYANQNPWYAENINPGTYFYRIIVNPKNPNPEVKHGYLTVIK